MVIAGLSALAGFVIVGGLALALLLVNGGEGDPAVRLFALEDPDHDSSLVGNWEQPDCVTLVLMLHADVQHDSDGNPLTAEDITQRIEDDGWVQEHDLDAEAVDELTVNVSGPASSDEDACPADDDEWIDNLDQIEF